MTRLADLERSFQGVVPSLIATCSADGTPNVTYLSQVYNVDEKHVALSCQFFNKTKRNVGENPYACVNVMDPITLEAHELRLRFVRSEASGPLFDRMAARIEAIASHTGMKGVFRLLSADVYEVESVREIPEFLDATSIDTLRSAPQSLVNEITGLHLVSEKIRCAHDLEGIFTGFLDGLREGLGFEHAMLLLADETGRKLYTVASHGYDESGVGAEVAIGDGLIGAVAERKKTLRVSDVEGDLRYGRAIRRAARGHARAEIPLPGLADAQSQLAIPLLAGDRLIGVVVAESTRPMAFDAWHESFLGVIANHAAVAIERAMTSDDEEDEGASKRTFAFYKNDDQVFVDGEYLIKNVPGRILWRILTMHAAGRTDFTNRELRLDAWLGLPAIKDNLESRLILLRRRLEQKCPEVKLVSTGRGRFRVEVGCRLELVEK